MKAKDLKPLLVFRNTWRDTLGGGYVILLSRDLRDEDGKICGDWIPNATIVWQVAFSYAGMGAGIELWTDDEVLRCEYLGNIKEVFPKGMKNT